MGTLHMLDALTQLKRDIDSTQRCMAASMLGLPAMVWFFAALAGIGAQLHYAIQHRLQRRLERLQRERRALVSLLMSQAARGQL